MRRRLISIGVVCLVLLAGCTGLSGQTDDTTTTESTTVAKTTVESTGSNETTTAAETTAEEGTATEEPTDEPTAEQTTAAETTTATQTETATTTQTETANPSWDQPKSPNTPLQNKMSDEQRARIKSITVADQNSDGSVELQVTANTSMQNVDPKDHGTVQGEPYFLVYVNGSLTNGSRFSEAHGTLAERSSVHFRENGQFTLTIPKGAFEESGASGEVDVMVLLMDEDSEWDDIYGVKTVTVEYSSDE